MIALDTQGLWQVTRKLRTLGLRDAKDIATRGTIVASEPVARAAKDSARSMVGGQMGGMIADAVAVKPTFRLSRGFAVTLVTLRDRPEFHSATKSGKRRRISKKGSLRMAKGDYFIPAAIEYGHAAPYSRTNVKVARPIPYMRKARQMAEQAAVRAGQSAIVKLLDQRVRYG